MDEKICNTNADVGRDYGTASQNGEDLRLRSASNVSAQAKYRILAVDDEIAIANLVKEVFLAEGMEVEVAFDPVSALDIATSSDFDLAIVDIMMPLMDGYEFCRRLKSVKDIPVIFLSAKDEETDIVVGFALGAEDYVTKPFKPRELIARVKARLRRASVQPDTSSGQSFDGDCVFCAKGITLDVKSHSAALYDIPLTLTPKEFDILAMLLRRKGEPVSAKEIYEQCWRESYNSSSANTVMVHIRHLRSKFAAIDSTSEFIETAWGVGYRISER